MADDMIPASPGAKRVAIVAIAAIAVAGTLVVWWVSSYLDSLTTLAQSDPDAALALFRSRVLPVFAATVLASVVAGGLLARQGVHVLRAGEFPPPGMPLTRATPRRTGRPALMVGWLLTMAGALLAIVPLAMLVVVIVLLQRL